MSFRKDILDRVRRLIRAEQGVAAVEFALVLPIMLFVYLGTLEASTLITMDRKVQSVAGAVGDLVARANGTITSSELQDYFQAASGIMIPYSADEVAQVVTAIQVSSDGKTATVVWTRKLEDGNYTSLTPYTVGGTYPLPEAMTNIAKGQMVIAAEASYTAKPLVGVIFDVPVNLYRASYFLSRFGEPIGIS
ncbi:TadE/TadG family type IV pilus assembly protein [Devosia sp. XK-2]|uniref:TadE/TadG family type IV pilus assembly protein n=1 Tax=Devosia sp. XK-2 TaxID=3126689 RepID=UPI0030CE7D22